MKKYLLSLVALLLSCFTASATDYGLAETKATSLIYTLDTSLDTNKGQNNTYDGKCDVTVDGLTWNVTGNSTMAPWRIGGKSLTNVNREVKTTTAYASNVEKIVLSLGDVASGITVNSVTLAYADNAGFTNAKTIVEDHATSIDFAPEGGFGANMYYKFILNVSVSGTSNKFVTFKKVEFYGSNAEPEPEVLLPTFSEMVPGEEYYLYNVEYDGRFLAANDWNTRASISSTYGFVVKVASEADGKYSISNLNENKENAWLKVFTDGISSIWTDNNSGANCNNWQIVALGDNKYQITNSGVAGLLGAYNNGTDTRLYMRDASEAGFCSTWAFVTKADWEAYIEEKEQSTGDYSGRMSNDKAKWTGATGVYGGGGERYNEAGQPEGDIMTQTIENLPAGKYEVKFHGISNVARNLDVAVWAGEGIAYVFANGEIEEITVGTKAALDEADWTNGLHTINCEIGEDGILKYGIANHKAGSQWAVVKAVSLIRTGDLDPEVDPYTTSLKVTGEGSTSLSDKIKINDNTYDAYKIGTSSKTGTIKVTIPAGSYGIGFYALSWSEDETDITATAGEKTKVYHATGAGITGSSPYTYDAEKGGEPDMHLYAFGYDEPLEEDVVVTLTAPARALFFGINPLAEAPEHLITEGALVANGEEITLNEHAEVSIEHAEGVVAKVAASVKTATYVVRNMMEIAGEESSQWIATDTIAAGEMSINGIANADFDEAINFEKGMKYMITINAVDIKKNDEAVSYIINGSYTEPLISEAAIVENGMEVALNAHSEVSAEQAEAVAAKVASSVREASYVVRNMMEIAGEESSQWVATDTIAAGEMSINGTAFAEFDETIYFAAGSKYQITINAKDAAEVEESVNYIINGSYVEPLVSEATLVLGGEEIALNAHSEVSADAAESITANVAASVREASYVVRNMMEIAGEESTQWIATDTIAAGEMSINGTAFAEFDETIYFAAGSKYMVTIAAKDAEEVEESVSYIINGAYTEPLVSEASVISNGEAITLNAHSEVSVEQAEAVSATVASSVREASYVVRNMMEIAGEESSQWIATDTIAAGEMSINGTAFAEFDEVIIFAAGSKYMVTINAKDAAEVEESVNYIINGSYVEPLVSEATLVLGGEEIALNEHSAVSADAAESITANVAASVREASYVVRNMMEIAGEESSQWIATDTIATGEMSINSTAFAKFEETIYFAAGSKYQITINAKNAEEVEQSVDYIINGSYVEPLVSEASVISNGEAITLNAHAEVSVEQAEGVSANVSSAVREASYAVRNMMLIAGEESSQWIATDTIAAGEMSINGTAFADFDEAINFIRGNKYMITIAAKDAEENEESASYIINGAGEKPAPELHYLPLEYGKEVYLYNVEYDGFFLGANDWGTRASIAGDKGYRVKIEETQDGCVAIVDFCEKFNEWRRTFAGNGSDIWVDNNNGANALNWKFTDLGDNKYQITNTGVPGLLGVNNNGDTRLYMSEDASFPNTTWAFVSAEEYEAYAAYKHTAVNLEALAAQKALIDGTNVHDVEGWAAYVKNYEETLALVLDGNYEGNVVNPTTPTDWHASTAYNFLLTPWTIGGEQANNFDKALYINTWSTEGGIDGTNFTVPFFEYWTGDGESLAANTLATTVTDLVPGNTYNVSVWARVRVKNGASDPEGITFVAGNGEAIDVCAGEQVGESPFYLINVLATGEADEEGKLVVAFNVAAENTISWLSYKNVFVEEVVEPIIAEAVLVDAEETEYALNTHSAISMEKQTAMIVRFGKPAEVATATYAIQAIVGYDEETGDPILGVPTWGEFSISTYGYAEQAYTYNKGMQFMITIEAILQDGITSQTEQYIVNGAYEAEPLTAVISGEGTELNVTYAVGTDLGDNYAVKPYILDAEEQQIDVDTYEISNTTGGFFDPLNLIVISLNATLADGTYTLVLPAGMFIVNGGDNNDEWRYEFTVDGGTITAINSIAAGSKTVADGKYLENGKITIVKDGVKYQINGARK